MRLSNIQEYQRALFPREDAPKKAFLHLVWIVACLLNLYSLDWYWLMFPHQNFDTSPVRLWTNLQPMGDKFLFKFFSVQLSDECVSLEFQ